MLLAASDAEVLEKLTAVRGLGKWSVEMFACFGLKRMDVFSTGDLGVQYVSFFKNCYFISITITTTSVTNQRFFISAFHTHI